jgi:endonuclease/exonuclease/phosphatase (EEP) superfamily protein YafD
MAPTVRADRERLEWRGGPRSATFASCIPPPATAGSREPPIATPRTAPLADTAHTAPARPRKIISWNLLRTTGAQLDDIVRLIRREQPDLLLMQEATHHIEGLTARIGGSFARAPLPGRIHGLAMWSPTQWAHPPTVIALPAGTMFERVCQILDLGDFAVANAHLSHGQVLNRRQLRRIAKSLPAHAAVLGDYNLVGPCLLPGFREVGPRRPTHRMADILPLRLDRCLVRGLECRGTDVLPRERSDHHPIVVHLALAASTGKPRLRDRAGTALRRRRAAGRAGSARPDPSSSSASSSASA